MNQYMDCEQVATILQCSVTHVQKLIREGKLKAYRPVRAYLIAPEDLDAFIKSAANTQQD